jgi:uncharacterized membrane protein required for colicin V production
MIAAAAATKSMALSDVPFNWFDLALVVLLIFGLFRGRKNGMSKEILPLFLWLVMVLAGAFLYKPVAQLLVSYAGLKSVTSTFLIAYFIIAFVVFLMFSFLKRIFKEKLGGNNFFGSSEYYLGMISGFIRYACILIFFMALLNAPYYSAADIQAKKDYNARWFGGGLQGYSGNYIPDLQSVQESVFKTSLIGPHLKDYLDILLIETGAAAGDKKPPAKKPVIHIGN